MPDRRSRLPLRSKGLPIALACTLAAGLGGCSTFGAPAIFGAQTAECRSDAWPTQVFGSLQRTELADISEPVAAYRSEPVKRSSSKRAAKRVARERAEPVTDHGFEPTVTVSSEPLTEKRSEEGVEEPKPWTVTESKPVAVAENSSVSQPAVEAPPSAEPAAPAEQPGEPETPQDSARPQEPVVPPRPQPSPEVIAVCGADDTTCQDQLTALLADPLHKWIDEKPAQEDSTGVRILAYRVLTPVLACEDLRKGLRETAAAPDEAQSDGSEGALQLLRRSVNLELKAEIAKRC